MALNIPGALEPVVTALVAAGVRATTDPSEVNTPGAWVTWEGFQALNIAGSTRHMVVVYLIVDDNDYTRSIEALSALYDDVVPLVLRPDGQVVPQGVALPGSPNHPLPALRVPVHVDTNQE